MWHWFKVWQIQGYRSNRVRHVRDRYLLPDEWVRVNRILLECPLKVRVYFTVLLLIGARRGELLQMEWTHVDMQLGIWRKPHTKNGRSQTIALPRTVCDLLGQVPHVGSYVFTGDPCHNGTKASQPWSGTAVTFWWRKIRTAAAVPDVCIHDLRRTLGAWMTMNGESLRIIQTIMHHSDIQTTARVYTPLQINTQREALDRHADHVLGARSYSV